MIAHHAHTEQITTGEHTYVIEMNGTADGENTRSPVGYQVYDQTFEPNLFVRMENLGNMSVVNPWLIARGRDWRTVSSIVAGVVDEGMSGKEKALALWTFHRHHRFHASPYDHDNGNVVKMLNVYGYTLCGDDSYTLADLWREAGLRVRNGHPIGHSTSEVFYDGMWHLLDGDEHVICLMRDNQTIAGEEEIVADHDLMKRTHVYGILRGDDRQTDEFSASLFPFEGEREEKKGVHPSHEMKLTLRPGEALEWRWDGRGKFHGRENMGSWRNAWTRICNGVLHYKPDVKSNRWRAGAVEMVNVANSEALCSQEETASVVFEMKSPYVIVGGCIRGTFQRSRLDKRVGLFVSFDQQTWTEVWTAGEVGVVNTDVCLDRFFPSEGEARYGYYVRVDFCGEGVHDLEILADLQMAPLSLPGVRLGVNEMVYVDETEDGRQVQITHEWRERPDWAIPPAPKEPVFPVNGCDVEGTQFAFDWEPVVFDAGIADYHFQLSRYEDMQYLLSPNFEKLISRVGSGARYDIPYVGLLNPGERYFWRVRARSEAGVWSNWSSVWSFTPQAPGVSLAVKVAFDRETKKGLLTWEANSEGRRPVHYLVYGSDERGFTASDDSYPVLVEKGRTEICEANAVGESETPLFEIAPGEKVHAFYRVVAIDGNGNRSGVSNMAEALRPIVWTLPATEAKVGGSYRNTVNATRSIGDLRTVRIDGNPYNPAFRDADVLMFEIEKGPQWLSINRITGEMIGCPTDAGIFDVKVKVTREQGGEDTQVFTLNVLDR